MIYVKISGRIFKQLCQWNGTKSWVNVFLMLYKRENGEEEPQVKYKVNKISQGKVRRFVLKLQTATAKEFTWLYFYFMPSCDHTILSQMSHPLGSVPRSQERWCSPPNLVASSWMSCQLLWKWVKAFIISLFLFNDILKDLTQSSNDWSACCFSL